jgi:hypothetical protein
VLSKAPSRSNLTDSVTEPRTGSKKSRKRLE